MLSLVAQKTFDSERFDRILVQSSVRASSSIHTNVSSLLLVLRAQTGSPFFFFFSFSISPVSETLRDPFFLLVFKTKVLEVLVSVKGRFAI